MGEGDVSARWAALPQCRTSMTNETHECEVRRIGNDLAWNGSCKELQSSLSGRRENTNCTGIGACRGWCHCRCDWLHWGLGFIWFWVIECCTECHCLSADSAEGGWDLVGVISLEWLRCLRIYFLFCWGCYIVCNTNTCLKPFFGTEACGHIQQNTESFSARCVCAEAQDKVDSYLGL